MVKKVKMVLMTVTSSAHVKMGGTLITPLWLLLSHPSMTESLSPQEKVLYLPGWGVDPLEGSALLPIMPPGCPIQRVILQDKAKSHLFPRAANPVPRRGRC